MLETVSNNTQSWRWTISLFCLTFLALIVRWYYVSTALVIHPVRGDATQYVSYAWNLLTHGTFAKDLPGSASITADNYRDPGYPLFLALLMKAFGTEDIWYASVLLCQALLGALTVALSTQLGKFWLASRWALLAGILMAVWPHSVSITGVLLSETLLSFLCAAALLAFAIACRRGSYYWAFSSGLIFGAAALTNSVLVPFGVVLAALFAWRRLAARPLCAALAIGALLLPGCWALRNSQLPPASVDSSRDRALLNFAQGELPNYHQAYRDSFFGNAVQKKHASATLSAVDAQYALLRKSLPDGLGAFLGEVEKQPASYAFWYLVEKPHELWDWNIVFGQGDIYVYPTVNSPFKTFRLWIALEAVCQSLNPLMTLLGAAGLLSLALSSHFRHWASPARHGLAPLIAVAFLLAFATTVYCVLQEEPRYSIPYRPFEILMAFTAIAAANRFWISRSNLARASP
ncbi:glycosyltransferase family 39 protein [Rhodanobacter sp. BL-MT-08]